MHSVTTATDRTFIFVRLSPVTAPSRPFAVRMAKASTVERARSMVSTQETRGWACDGDAVRYLPSQSSAEHYADGLAAGLRVAGHMTEIVIDVPEEPTVSEDDADLLDFASFDAWAQDHGIARAETPEADPVAVRLAREAEAGHYRAKVLGLS